MYQKAKYAAGFLTWRLRVWSNRRRHKDIVADERRGCLKSDAAAAYMLMRDRQTWHNAGGIESGLRCPDIFDYDACVQYAVVVEDRKKRAADLEKVPKELYAGGE